MRSRSPPEKPVNRWAMASTWPSSRCSKGLVDAVPLFATSRPPGSYRIGYKISFGDFLNMDGVAMSLTPCRWFLTTPPFAVPI